MLQSLLLPDSAPLLSLRLFRQMGIRCAGLLKSQTAVQFEPVSQRKKSIFACSGGLEGGA